MTVRIFKKVASNFKCNSNVVFKYSHSIPYASNVSCVNVHNNLFANNKVSVGYLSNKRNFSSMQNASSHQRKYTKALKGPLLLYNKDIVSNETIPTNYHALSVNGVREYSNSTPMIINDTIKYNNGIFKMISESVPVEWATEVLRLMHYQTGLPWWASIVFTTIIARTTIHFPLTLLDHQTRARRENLKPEMMKIAKNIKMQVKMEQATTQISSSHALFLYKQALSKEQKELFERENCHPFKSVAIVLLQTPIWISFSVAMRNMCYMLPDVNAATLKDYNELTLGGFGWMQNLIDIDHSFILPVLFSVSGLAMIEINQVLFNTKPTKFSNIYINFCRLLIICFVPIAAYLPSGLSLFWVTNNCCAVFQSLLFMSPKIRRLVGIPKTDSELQHPYTELYKRFIGKFVLKRSVAKV